MKFEIKSRYDDTKVLFTAEIECGEDTVFSIKLGLAVKKAVAARANLADANLAGANLAGAYLAGANLAGGVKVYEHTFYRAPIQISDRYFINLWDGFLTIGCERHLVSEWEAFDGRCILDMDGKDALKWWNVWKPVLMGMAKATGRENLPEQKKDAA